MKIRKRDNPSVVVVVADQPQGFQPSVLPFAYTKPGDVAGEYKVYLFAEWEPVPVERWENVTSDCQADDEPLKNDRGLIRVPVQHGAFRDGVYRVRKVKVCLDENFYGINKSYDWAFLVEKKVSK